jgi:luciferase family oxidoreductase group 1
MTASLTPSGTGSPLDRVAFSVLDLVSIRADGTAAEAIAASVATARHAERLGFARYWLAEHHNMDGVASSATAVLVGHIAASTRRIRVGSGGVMLPNHAPLVVAEQFGTLATLHPDRIDLGLGRAPGADPLTMRALRRDRMGDSADDFPQQVQELQALLGPSRPGQRLVAMPGAGTEVPIWLLGSSLFSAQLAARLGLPYAFASHFAPRFLDQAIAMYRDQFEPSAVLDRPYLAIGVPLIAAPTDDEAQFQATTSRQRILALLRGQSLRLQPPIGPDEMERLWSPPERQAVESFLEVGIVGGPQRVRRGLEALAERTGADEMLLVSEFHDVAHRLRAFDLVAGLRSSAAPAATGVPAMA